MTAAADRHLLFGLLALQNGLIDQDALVAAFQAWTRDKVRSLADPLVARGEPDADVCVGLEPPPVLPVVMRGVVPPVILTRCRARFPTVVLGWIPPGP